MGIRSRSDVFQSLQCGTRGRDHGNDASGDRKRIHCVDCGVNLTFPRNVRALIGVEEGRIGTVRGDGGVGLS